MTYTREDLAGAFKGQFMQPEVYHGDVIELQYKNGDSFFIPLGDYSPTIHSSGVMESFTFSDRYLARLSASGYLDCTESTMFDTEQEAIAFLINNYAE